MSVKGYILNGTYVKANQAPLEQMVTPQQTMYKQHDHARQRFDHAAEIIQPYTLQGKPNPQFIESNPEAAVRYGFIPKPD